MITITCPACGKAFAIPEEWSGRKARCKACMQVMVVPNANHPGDTSRHGVAQPPPLPNPIPPSVVTQPPVRSHDPGPSSPSPPPSPIVLTPPPIRIEFNSVDKPRNSPPVVPATSESPPNRGSNHPGSPVKSKVPVRTRRLLADSEQMSRVFRGFPMIKVQSVMGNPPELYRVEYSIRGLVRGAGGNPVVRDTHLAEIQLTLEYPRQSPKCKMLTPIFHPNIDPVAICVGDHWTASERLVDLVVRIGEMIAYQAYNIKSPLDGEAAMWADLHRMELPMDRRDLRPPGWG